MMTEVANKDPWHLVRDAFPPRNEPVLCAWRFGPRWHYAVAKFTGKRWLEVLPETDNEEFLPPTHWQYIKAPDSASERQP